MFHRTSVRRRTHHSVDRTLVAPTNKRQVTASRSERACLDFRTSPRLSAARLGANLPSNPSAWSQHGRPMLSANMDMSITRGTGLEAISMAPV